MNPALLSSRGESLYSLVTATVSLGCAGCEAKQKTRPGGSACIAFKMKNWLHAQVEQLEVSSAVPGSHHVLHADLSDPCACSGQDTLSQDTQWNWASTYCLWKRLNIKMPCLCSQRTLSCCWNAVLWSMLWTSTDWIFSGVICLPLDPVAQSDCHGPSGKDFQLTKPHYQSSQ